MPKILIIDNTQNLNGFLKDILVRRGYVVHAVSDPDNGLLLFKNQKPNLTFVGLNASDANGDIVKQLKALNPTAPIAVLSSTVTKEIEGKVSEWGCAGFVYKGLKPEDLLQSVMEICGRHAPLSSEAGGFLTKGRILVVDDEEVIRTVLFRFLKNKGYDVVTAANGREALDRIKKERPHLMLLDIRMPEMDGFEVLRTVRAIDREIAVMMITANTDVADARRTMEMGACDYIIKPFHLDYLETTVMAKLLLVTA